MRVYHKTVNTQRSKQETKSYTQYIVSDAMCTLVTIIHIKWNRRSKFFEVFKFIIHCVCIKITFLDQN